MDEQGNIVWGDELLVIFARDVLQRNPNATIISEVKCSQRLYDDIVDHGGVPIMWKAGHSLLKAKLKETNALLAGEMSGHMFFKERYFGYDDAIYASLRLLEIIANSGQTFLGLARRPASDCIDTRRSESIARTIGNLSSPKEQKNIFVKHYDIIDIDGVRVQFPEGWGLIRASNTQPALVLRFEAQTAEKLNEYRALVESKLKELEI